MKLTIANLIGIFVLLILPMFAVAYVVLLILHLLIPENQPIP